jgi:hypothetical protein
MPINSSLLYGEMAASGLINVTLAIFGGFLVSSLAQMFDLTDLWRSLILLAFIVGLSTAIQYGLFVALQANSCGKVTNYSAIAKATGQGALITAIMVAIPLFVEPMRLVVSEALAQFGIGGGHQVPLTPALELQQDAIINAAQKIAAVDEKSIMNGGALNPQQFADQINREKYIGAAFWAAFAGAYGIGLGSLHAGTCKAV